MRIVEGRLSENWAALDAMLHEHAQELATNKELMVLAPDRVRYAAIEAANIMLTLLAYEGDELIGYSINFVSQHLHYSGLTYAQNDVLFVRAPYRKGRAGLALIQETERVCKERGAQMIVWHAKQGTALESLMPRLGYRVQDVMFSKEL